MSKLKWLKNKKYITKNTFLVILQTQLLAVASSSTRPPNQPGSSTRPGNSMGNQRVAPGGDSEDEDEGSSQDESDSFESLFSSFSQQWLDAQLTHNVSIAASNYFWKLAFNHVSQIESLKASEGIKRKIPQFLQVRKNLYKDFCPEVKMSFAFLNKNDGSIIHVDGIQTPLTQYERNPQYQKLYEEAHVEVQ